MADARSAVPLPIDRVVGHDHQPTRLRTLAHSGPVALHDLKLDSIDVIHAGRDAHPMTNQIRAVSFHQLDRTEVA